jgi:hypothetical protein
MKDYLVTIQLELEANDETEAIRKFWDRVDDHDYLIEPSVKEEV